jgi:hypothetical protein
MDLCICCECSRYACAVIKIDVAPCLHVVSYWPSPVESWGKVESREQTGLLGLSTDREVPTSYQTLSTTPTIRSDDSATVMRMILGSEAGQRTLDE